MASPLSTGPGCPSNAVHVVLGDVRQIEVDDVANIIDIDPARGDVGRNEGIDRTCPKTGQRPVPSTLTLVGVNRGNPAARFLKDAVQAGWPGRGYG